MCLRSCVKNSLKPNINKAALDDAKVTSKSARVMLCMRRRLTGTTEGLQEAAPPQSVPNLYGLHASLAWRR